MIIQTEANFNTYTEIMNSVSDKDNVLEFIPANARVLDFGCGNGALAGKFEPENYVGYDISSVMVDQARKKHPAHSFTSTLPVGQTFDVVLFSSVLHEVYSYGGKSFDKVIEVLKEAGSVLSPNGRVVIRDGAVPDKNSHLVSYRLVNPVDAREFLARLDAESQFDFHVTITGEGEITGTQRAVNRFLNVYTWGWDSFLREKDERVNFASMRQWLSMCRQAGLILEDLKTTSQEDYFDNLKKIVDLGGARWTTKIILSLEKK